MTMKPRLDFTAAIKSRIQAREAKSTGVSLADWRKLYGFTQENLATALGVNVFTVKKWEGGDRKPINFLGFALAAIVARIPPTKIDNSEVQNSLSQWRKERGFTQESLAAALDINVYTVKKWEGGSRKSIDFLGLALSAIDADLAPVKLKFERRISPKVDEDNAVQTPKPF